MRTREVRQPELCQGGATGSVSRSQAPDLQLSAVLICRCECGTRVWASTSRARREDPRTCRQPVASLRAGWGPLDVAKRILDGPGYGTTLGEVLVTDGLADTFSAYAYPKTPPIPWDEALQPNQLRTLGAIARDDAAMTNTTEVFSRWFLGAGNLPRGAGFTIGASWVRHFLTSHPQTDVTAATELTANKITGQ